jgi:hypothetical protein
MLELVRLVRERPATTAEQWYVSISRGRRGVGIFTPDNEQLRESITPSEHRKLGIELARSKWAIPGITIQGRLRGYLSRFGQQAANWFIRLKSIRSRHDQHPKKNEHQATGMLGERPKRSWSQHRSVI